MENLANEIRADVRHYHGERFSPSKPSADYKQEISEAIAIHSAMTQDERNAIAYLFENNRDELTALYRRVKERAGL